MNKNVLLLSLPLALLLSLLTLATRSTAPEVGIERATDFKPPYTYMNSTRVPIFIIVHVYKMQRFPFTYRHTYTYTHPTRTHHTRT